MKWIRGISLVGFSSLFAVMQLFILSSSVGAVSNYDNTISVTSSLQLTQYLPANNGSATKLDVSTSWATFVENACPTAVGQSLSSALSSNTGSWFVEQIAVNPSAPSYYVYWTTSSSVMLSFGADPYNPGGTSLSANQNVSGVQILSTTQSSATSATPQNTNCNANNWQPNNAIIDASGTAAPVFVSNMPITYPSGYAGAIIPTKYIPATKLQFVWSVDTTGRVEATYSTSTPLTTSQFSVISACGLNWTLTNSSGTVLSTQNTTALGSFVYQNLPISSGNTLEVAPYYCPPYIQPNPPDMIGNSVTIDFNGANAYGNSQTESSTASGGGMFPSVAGGGLQQFGLTNAIEAPINLVNTLTSQTCSPITLPFLGTTMTIPCMSNFYNKFQPLYSIAQVVITGFVAYVLALRFIHRIKLTLKPNDESIEVMQL